MIAVGILTAGVVSGVGLMAGTCNYVNNSNETRENLKNQIVELMQDEEIKKAKNEFVAQSCLKYEIGEKTLKEFDEDLMFVQSEEFFVETLKQNPEKYANYLELTQKIEENENRRMRESLIEGLTAGALLAICGATAYGIEKFSKEEISL